MHIRLKTKADKLRVIIFAILISSWVGFGLSVLYGLETPAALGAPTINYQPNILPIADSTYELGTSSAAWLIGTFDQICLTGDSCQTSWAGGAADGYEASNWQLEGSFLVPTTTVPVKADYFSATSTTASTFPYASSTAITATNFWGTASLATALAANGANCAAGNAPLGVDASGAVESCFDVWTEAENTAAAYLSTVDISDNTNLTADGTNVVLTDDALSLGTALSLTHASATSITATTLYGDGQNITLARIGDSTYSTVQHLQDIFHSTGYADGGQITDAGGGSVAVAAGNGFIRASNVATSTISYFDWAASSTIAIPSGSVRYIGIAYNGGSPRVESHASYDWDFQTSFPLGTVVNEGGTLHIESSAHRVGDHAGLMIQRAYDTMPKQRDNRSGGLILGETGTRNITVTAGSLWERLQEFPISAIDTSATDSFDTYCGTTKVAIASTTWDNANYCNAGTLTDLTANRYANLWFYIELDGALIMQYGTAQYATLAEAENESAPSTLSTRTSVLGTLIGRLVFKDGGSTANSIDSVYTTTFSASGAADHGNLAGLTDDDHTQYLLVNGSRALTGAWDAGSQTIYGVGGVVVTGSSTLGYASSTSLTVSGNSYLGTVLGGTWNGTAIDISDYTNLVAGTNITLSGDTLNVDDAFLLNNGDTGTGTYDFSGATLKQHTYKSFTWPGTPTTTTATTTVPLGTAYTAEAWNGAECYTTSGTSYLVFTDGTNDMNPRTATTTVGRFTLSTNNTFTASEKRYVEIGALTAAQLSCTVDITINN